MAGFVILLGSIGAVAALLYFSKKKEITQKEEQPESSKAEPEKVWVCYDCGAGFQMNAGKNPVCCPWCGKTDLELIPKDFDDAGHIYICPHCGELICSMCKASDAPQMCPSCKKKL